MPIVVRQGMSVIGSIASCGIGVPSMEQNPAQALKPARYAYVLERAQMAFPGSVADLAGGGRVRKVYLGR